MWSVKVPPGGARARERGFSLIEAVVVSFLVSMMSIALHQAIDATNSADQQLETMRRAALHGQRLSNEITELVASSRHIYDADVVGTAYLAACDLSRLPVAPDARMPTIEEEGDLGTDSVGADHTGNVLVLLREMLGSPCVADPATGKIRTIDTYRLTVVYPHVGQRVLMAGEAPSRDVVVWRSEAFPSLQQILAIEDKEERESVIEDLFVRYEYDYAWDPGAPIELAFYALNEKGEIQQDPAGPIGIEEDPLLTTTPRLWLSDAQLAATDPARFATRAVLTADEEGAWQPHGLEVKIVGGAQARRIWIHTVVEAARQSGRNRSVHACTTLADARDY